MRRYKYAKITYQSGGYGYVEVRSNDSVLLSWIEKEIKKMEPKCITELYPLFIGETGGKRKPVGENSYFRVRDLQGYDPAVGHWLVNQLCEQGWEPFAIDDDGRTYFFRMIDEVSS